MLAALFAFIETPAGIAAVTAIPNLVEQVITIGAQKGQITAADIAEYVASQQAFDKLVPKK